MKIRVLVRAEDEPLVMEGRAADRASASIVIKSRSVIETSVGQGGLREIVIRVEVAILRIQFAGTVPLVGAALGHDVEESTRGVTVFGAELIRDQAEFRNGIWNNGAVVSGDVEVVVVDTIHVKAVVTRTGATDGTAGTGDAARLCGRVWRQYSEVQRTAVEETAGIRKVNYVLRVVVVAEGGSRSLH